LVVQLDHEQVRELMQESGLIEQIEVGVMGVINLTELTKLIAPRGLTGGSRTAAQVARIGEQIELTGVSAQTELTVVTAATEKERGLNASNRASRETEVTGVCVDVMVIVMDIVKFASVESAAIGLKRLQRAAEVNKRLLAAEVSKLLLEAEVEHLMRASSRLLPVSM